MKMLAFDAEEYRAQFESNGWVHIRNGLTPEFLEVLQSFARESLVETRLERHAFKGKKEQSLYEFPDSVDFPEELFDAVASLCGLNRETMTLSERHIQAYESDAAPEPMAHKDRFASQVSVGFSIDIPAQSRLVLYPHDSREINPFNSSVAFQNSLQPDQLPELVLKNARGVVLDDAPGDVVLFPGSTTWHLRRNAANAVNLYCKFNDFNCDPLGEDPTTGERRSRTLELLQNGDGILVDAVPILSRRLDLVTRHHTRTWEEALQANLWGEEAFGLTQAQYTALQLVDGERSIDTVAHELAGNGASRAEAQRDVLRLAELGALDLLDPGSA